MRKDRPLVRLLILLLQALLELTVVRLTARFCVGACCKWAATTLVEALFSHHAWTLYIFSRVLDVTLLGFCIDLILQTLEDDLKVPARGWLDWLYTCLVPKGGAGEPPHPPASQQGSAHLKTVPLKRRKQPARRNPAAAHDTPDPAEAASPAVTQNTKPRRAPRRNKNQALKG